MGCVVKRRPNWFERRDDRCHKPGDRLGPDPLPVHEEIEQNSASPGTTLRVAAVCKVQVVGERCGGRWHA